MAEQTHANTRYSRYAMIRDTLPELCVMPVVSRSDELIPSGLICFCDNNRDLLWLPWDPDL